MEKLNRTQLGMRRVERAIYEGIDGILFRDHNKNGELTGKLYVIDLDGKKTYLQHDKTIKFQEGPDPDCLKEYQIDMKS